MELSRGEDGVCLASRRFEESESTPGTNEPVSWTDWAVCTGTCNVKILPGFPDRPVLAKVAQPFTVAPGEETRIYLRLPISVQVRLTDHGDEVLAELPSESLPLASFGGMPVAEECRQLSSPASRRPFEDLDSSEVQAPVIIRNDSREVLTVSQVCLRVDPLSIYEDRRGLWASETLACHQGGIHASRLSVKQGPPVEAPLAKLLVLPRRRGAGGMVGRTFRSFLGMAA